MLDEVEVEKWKLYSNCGGKCSLSYLVSHIMSLLKGELYRKIFVAKNIHAKIFPMELKDASKMHRTASNAVH